MSVFYCAYHDRPEDSDHVGFNETAQGDVCDDALDDILFDRERMDADLKEHGLEMLYRESESLLMDTMADELGANAMWGDLDDD